MVSFTQGDDSHFVGLIRLFAVIPGNEMVAVTLTVVAVRINAHPTVEGASLMTTGFTFKYSHRDCRGVIYDGRINV